MKALKTLLLLVCVLTGTLAFAMTDADKARLEDLFKNKDFSAHFSMLRGLVEQGTDPEAQDQFASCYCMGWGVPKNEDTCALWRRKAANQGHKEAMQFLAWDYGSGKAGAPKKPGYARDVWIRRAAQNGDAAAKFYIDEDIRRHATPGTLSNLSGPSNWIDPNYAVEKD